MKRNSRILLFGALILVLLSTACGTPSTGTPTAEGLTVTPSGTEMTPTSETPVATSTGETATPTATGAATTVPLQQVCSFCVQQVPHALVVIPEGATVEVLTSSSGVTCNSVETVEANQIVLCQGPKLSAMASFDLNVCNAGNCTKHQVALIDCSAVATAAPTATNTATPTPTVTLTMTAGASTATATSEAGATSTPTPEALTATPTP